jgi:ligand-binding sensor domain-containing protein
VLCQYWMNGRAPNMLMKLLLFFLIAIHLGTSLQAQRYSFINYTTQNGLVQSNITDIKQDKTGNIWIGTLGGISIFDGRTFTNFDDRSVLNSLSILSILCDSTGIVWVGTANGLLRYDHHFKTFFQPKDTVQARTSSLITYGGRILFICNSTIYEITKESEIKKVAIDGHLEKVAQFITFDISGNLWVVTDGQKVFKVVNDRPVEFKKPAYIDKIFSNSFGFIRVNGDASDQPYFVSNFGVLSIQGDTLGWFSEKYPRFFSMSTAAPTYIYRDPDSTLWIGATRGLVKLINRDSAIRFTKTNGFGNHSVSTIMRDREDNLWIGSTYYGVYRLSNEALFSPLPTSKADFKNISFATAINDSVSFVGTWGTGPFLLKGDSFVQMRFVIPQTEFSPGLNYITAVYHAGNVTYVSTLAEGLWKVKDGSTDLISIPLKERPSPMDNIIPNNDGFIIQNQDGNTFVYDKDFNVIRRSDSAIGMLRKANGKLFIMQWIGHTDIVDSNFKVVKRNVFPEIFSDISQIAAYKNKLLVSTLGDGLFLYDEKEKLVTRLHKGNGLNSNVVTSLLVDGDVLFAGTNYGLVRVELPEMKARLYNEKEGMFTAECRRQGLTRLSNDAILIATTSGPYIYHPSKDNTAKLAKGYISIAALSVGNNFKTYEFAPVTTNIRLNAKVPFSRNDIRVKFKGVSQRSPGDIIYHYRLSGAQDSAWKSTTSDEPAEFHDLPAGLYTFAIYVSVKDYRSPVSSVSFEIQKPLQSEWWFQLLVLAVVAVFLFFFLSFLNKLYQKYIQTRMIDEMGNSVRRKNTQMSQALMDTKNHLDDIRQMHYQYDAEHKAELNYLYVNAELTRMRSLVQRNTMTLGEFHHYFEEVMQVSGKYEKRIYQEVYDANIELPMEKCFVLMEIFSLYITWKLSENPHYLFSLNSEVRSSKRIVVRCYHLNSLRISLPSTLEASFRKMMNRLKDENWSVAFIENTETSSMLIAELEI